MEKGQINSVLEREGYNTSAKNKKELLELANHVSDLDLSTVEPDDDIEMDASFRAMEDGRFLPKALEFDTDLTALPPLSMADVLGACHWDNARLRNYRGDEGFQLFRSGHIDSVTICKVGEP